MNRGEFMQELEELFKNEPDNYKFNAVLEMADAYAENEYETKKLEEKILPENIDYETINGISLEGRQKLNKFKPRSIGQASRISGVSPADVSVLLVYLQQIGNKK